MSLEWMKDANEPVPEVLMKSLCNDLFRTNDSRNDDQESSYADHMASALFGSAAKLKFSAGGAEVELDRKSNRHLEKKKVGEE